jgi:hypothetical protein
MKARADVVCLDCNTRWMSRIEKLTGAALLPVLSSPSLIRNLNDETRYLISVWLTIKAIVLNHSEVKKHGREPFFDQQERVQFKDTLIPPDRISIWIGRLQNERERGGDVIPLYGDPEPPGRTNLLVYCLTMSALSVVLQFLAVRDADNAKPSDEVAIAIGPVAGSWDDYVLRLWPDSGTVRWPPRRQLVSQQGQGDLQFFAYRFFGLPPSLPPFV